MNLAPRAVIAEAVSSRYRMRRPLLSGGNDYWIECEDGSRAFRVDGKALRIRQTLVFEDTTGHEVARLRERRFSFRETLVIERDGRQIATVKKALVGIRDRLSIDVVGGTCIGAKGNLVDHEYEITRDGDTVAVVSRGWFTVRDAYGVEIAPGEDDALLLAITVSIDALTDWRD